MTTSAHTLDTAKRGACKRAVVFGATGYTGQHVVGCLRERGSEVWAHARPDSSRLSELRPLFETAGAHLHTSPWEPGALDALLDLARPDVVFSLLGTTRKQARSEQLDGNIYETVEGRLTRLAIDATRRQAPTARFVFLSSVGTHAGTQNAYLATRAEVERYLAHSGLAHTIVRAPIISGSDRPERRVAERLAAKTLDGVLSLAGALGARSLQRQYESLDGRQLAHYLVQAAEDPACVDQVLEPRDLRERFTR